MTLQFQKLCSYQLHTADNEIESHLYFARYGFHQALGFCFMWCVALPYSQVPRFLHRCLLCTASFFSCILLDLPCLNQLVGSLPRLFYFSSYSVLLASEISL